MLHTPQLNHKYSEFQISSEYLNIYLIVSTILKMKRMMDTLLRVFLT